MGTSLSSGNTKRLWGAVAGASAGQNPLRSSQRSNGSKGIGVPKCVCACVCVHAHARLRF